ncbi:MAG: hypothetical protein JXA66_02950, partial [Oligoflexia bacterium]|nr:hypothetical protein [Oligoflexia bacterium]
MSRMNNNKSSLDDKFFKINPSWLVPNIPLGFELYIFLPQNKKLINYLKRDSVITNNKLDKFIKNKIASFYCLREQMDDFNRFVQKVRDDLSSKNQEIPDTPAIMVSQGGFETDLDKEFDIDVLRQRTEKIIQVISKIIGTDAGFSNVEIKGIIEKINSEIHVIKDSLASLEDEDIYIIENSAIKIKEFLRPVKEYERTANPKNKVSDIFSYYIHLLDNLT